MTCVHCVAYDDLGQRIQALDFDTCFRIENGAVVTMRYIHAPTVMHDPVSDVEIDGEGWSCLEGMTGQYAYHGAVMHPSEYIGAHIAKELAEMDEGTVFAIVTVDTYPEDEDGETENVGWAIAYRDTEITNPHASGTPEHAAYAIGHEHGVSLGTWVEVDDEATAERLREMDEDCELGDEYPGSPLSGEWADSYSIRDLATELEIDCEASDQFQPIDAAADAYQDGHYAGWSHEVMRAVNARLA